MVGRERFGDKSYAESAVGSEWQLPLGFEPPSQSCPRNDSMFLMKMADVLQNLSHGPHGFVNGSFSLFPWPRNGLLANLRSIADEFCVGKKLRCMRLDGLDGEDEFDLHTSCSGFITSAYTSFLHRLKPIFIHTNRACTHVF